MAITLPKLLSRIEHADTAEIEPIINALSRRYTGLHPDWEIAVLFLPKEDPAERHRILARILEYEQIRREGH